MTIIIYIFILMTTNPLVYSTDSTANRHCSKCRQIHSECTCRTPTPVGQKKITAVLRMEKAGRNGKPVTVIDRLPKNETFLDELARELKKKCGCGGTFRVDSEFGVIEIQGDKREQLRVDLAKRGYTVKG